MRRVEFAFYLLPNRNPRAKPYKSAWKMDPTEAAARGAIERLESTVEVRLMPETDDEKLSATMHYQSAGHDRVAPPPRKD